jgi:hypothetical protein
VKKNIIHCTKIILALAIFTLSLPSLAEPPEVSALIQTLNSEHTLTKTISDINSHQLKKRLSLDEGSQPNNEKLIKFFRHIESMFGWNEIRPFLAEQYKVEFNKKEIQKPLEFLKTKEGQLYVNEFQDAATSIALTLDDYTDTITDHFFDANHQALDAIKIENGNIKNAKKLIQKITPAARKDAFNEGNNYKLLQKLGTANQKASQNYV